MTNREVLPGCARVRTKCAEKTKCWSVRTDYILEKLPDVSGLGLVEAGRYMLAQGVIFLQGRLIHGSNTWLQLHLHVFLLHHLVTRLELPPPIQLRRRCKSLLRVLHPWHRRVEQATYNVIGARDMGT